VQDVYVATYEWDMESLSSNPSCFALITMHDIAG